MTIYDAGPLAAGPLCGLLSESVFGLLSVSFLQGHILYTHPPTPENTLLGVGGAYKKRGGGYKIPAAGASKCTPPPPPVPETNALWAKNAEGGGIYNVSLDFLYHA